MSEPQADNMYPNNGEYFTISEPVEQELARKNEKAHTLKALKVIKETISWFDQQIEYFKDVDNIETDFNDDPIKHQQIMNAHRIVRNKFEEKKGDLHNLLDEHAKNL